MATITSLAKELDVPTTEIAEYLRYACGLETGDDFELMDDEAESVRHHWADPTPQYQWQVTEGGPSWEADTRNEHDESL